MRHGSRVPAILLAVAVLTPSGLAFADAEIQATIAASTGWTDNYTAGSGTTSDSVFTSLEPGAQVLSASENTVQRLSYRMGLNFFLAGGGSTSLSNNLAWDLSHTISDFTESLLSASISHITTDTATPVTTDVGGGINALPAGANQFLGFNLGAGLSHQISDLWRTTQGVNGSYTTPVSSDGFLVGKTFTGTAALGLDRDFENSNAGINLGGTYTFIEGLGMGAVGAGPLTDQKQVLFTAVARYTRPFTPEWTLDVSAGAAGAAPADDVGNLDIFPTGGGVLGWQVEKHSAGISYNHGVVLNPFLRQNIVADDVVVRGGIPLADSRWLITGAIGYQHARTLTFDSAENTATLNLFSVDVALAYEISPLANLGARYQFADQSSDAVAGTMTAVVPDLVRNSISLVFTAKYPDQTKTVIPFRQPLKMLRDPTLGEPERPRGRGF